MEPAVVSVVGSGVCAGTGAVIASRNPRVNGMHLVKERKKFIKQIDMLDFIDSTLQYILPWKDYHSIFK
ncbi:MAG: hypothetical protein CMM22_00495 [Rhodospirillaceae bacterium]|nr:hypothetical protein [Rhodospirillaceae bacterium]